MPKTPAQNRHKQFDANTLIAYAVVGIFLIALGVVIFLSAVGVLEGELFEQVKQIMQGLSGGLAYVFGVLLVWAGIVIALSAGRNMPKRGLILLSVGYLIALAIINLLSVVGTQSLMDYVVSLNKSAAIANDDSFVNMAARMYTFCAERGQAGGVFGMLLAWPVWTFLGLVLGTLLLGILGAVCLFALARFDLVGIIGRLIEGISGDPEEREAKRRKQEYELAMAEQQRVAAENERLLITPAYLRRGNAMPQGQVPPMGYPPYGSMLQQIPPQQPMQPMQHAPYPASIAQVTTKPHAEMYDEVITPKEQVNKFFGLFTRSTSKDTAKETQTNADTQEELWQPTNRLTAYLDSRNKSLNRVEEVRKNKEQSVPSEVAPSPTPVTPMTPPAPLVVEKNNVMDAPTPEVMPIMASSATMNSPIITKATEPMKTTYVPADDSMFKPPAKPKVIDPPAPKKPYVFPPVDLLSVQPATVVDTREQDAENAKKLEKTLQSFGIPARVQRVTHGPAVTRFELGLVSSGINVKRIAGIADNIALDMAANGGVRIEIPIPGTNLFGIEIPNKEIQSVMLSDVLLSPEMQEATSPLAVALGRDIAGKPILCDIAKMPHLLIAGQTGSGKSVCINTIINSILFRSTPEEVRMIMIDPKVVELQCYNVVPHLLIPVVSDPQKAAGALSWAVAEMLDRYHKMQSKNVREMSAYNAKVQEGEEKLPRIVIIIDELADLMLACKKDVEESIIRLAQLARAAGIHMIVATQRPTVDVITGLIKANIPSRIAFAVSSAIDSRTILDCNGAEKLLGRGDMFYAPTGSSSPMRVQGCFLSDAETERIMEHIASYTPAQFDHNVIEALENSQDASNPLDDSEESTVDDRLIEAIEMVLMDGQASISMLQRRMKIGYARAGRLIDDMANRGIVSKSAGSKPREVLMSREEFDQIRHTIV